MLYVLQRYIYIYECGNRVAPGGKPLECVNEHVRYMSIGINGWFYGPLRICFFCFSQGTLQDFNFLFGND